MKDQPLLQLLKETYGKKIYLFWCIESSDPIIFLKT